MTKQQEQAAGEPRDLRRGGEMGVGHSHTWWVTARDQRRCLVSPVEGRDGTSEEDVVWELAESSCGRRLGGSCTELVRRVAGTGGISRSA